MVRTTKTPTPPRSAPLRDARCIHASAALILAALALLLTGGCSSGVSTQGAGSAEATPAAGAAMAGAVQKVVISKEAINQRPAPWNLSSPESAVGSYLDWISYAYRITESSVATPTMSATQEVRVDSYIQLNLQKSRILDQGLASITFGKPSVVATRALLPATEKWGYRYVSISEVGKTIAGPYLASYETTYTLLKGKSGWVVDSVAVKALGEVE